VANLTGSLRRWMSGVITSEQLLPEELPEYTRSFVYMFGALTLGSFVCLVASGMTLALFGPQWWHLSAVGHFVNSIHFWSVQCLFFFMVLHLWSQFFMAAWRGGRRLTWVVGALLFVASIMAAFTGYLSQQNFDSQWIAVQGKDAMNAVGIGAFFNLLNFGQMYSIHVAVMPAVIAGLITVHLILVRRRGLVPPLAPDPAEGGPERAR
jgi:quinol-cytochrome oxidoreductase complex cytochrome b subunit